MRSLWRRAAAAGLTVLLAAPASQAATYYLRNGGDDSADGQSHDTAWATLERVNEFDFAPGDRLLLQEGGRWQGQLLVDWSGTADRRAVVGAYRLENGSPTPGFESRRPVIDGNDQIPSKFDGLVRVRGDRVRVENLEVVNSEGRGIQFEGALSGSVVNCVTSNTYKSGIKFVDSDYAVARGNTVTRAGVANPEDGSSWGGAIELVSSNGGRIANNEVREVYGEGLNANDGSSGAVIENNRVFAARAVGIYLDAAPNATVRRNLVVGTSNTEFWRTSTAVGAGIALNNENYHYQSHGGSLSTGVQTQGARIYANMVAYTTTGIGFWGKLDETSFDDVLVFNNTLVDNNTQIRVRAKPKPDSRVSNNILLSISTGTEDVDRTDLAGMTARNNYLSQGDPGGDWSDSGNRYEGIELAKMSGWRTLTGLDDVSWKDFVLQGESSAIGAGNEAPVTLAAGDDTFDLDFNEQPHNEPVDMGALRYAEQPLQVPKKPTKIRGTP